MNINQPEIPKESSKFTEIVFIFMTPNIIMNQYHGNMNIEQLFTGIPMNKKSDEGEKNPWTLLEVDDEDNMIIEKKNFFRT